MDQNTLILEMLKRGPVTPMDALREAGCMRLASRINELRGEGHRITSRMVTNNGKRYAEYHLTG
jgi:hypothetical protein